MTNREIENKRKRKFWQKHIEKCEKSGLLQVEYCRQNNLIPHRFVYWKAKFKKIDSPVCFVPVPLKNTDTKTPLENHHLSALRLVVGQRYQIDVGENFSPSTLKTLLQVLEGI